MSLKVNDITNAAEDGPPAFPQGIDSEQVSKGWTIYDQSVPTVKDSFNVDTVTDVSTGVFIVNWTVPFATANYAVVATPGEEDPAFGANTLNARKHATDSVEFFSADGNNNVRDSDSLGIVAFGEQ